MKRRAFFALTFIVLFSFNLHAAEIDPAFKFSTIETAHFKVHYHREIEEIAQRASVIAEEAHCLLEPAFKWTPYEKTHLVLIDSSDFANGFTGVLPYNFIYIYVVPPEPDMTIGQYEDWLRLVILHEYAHVLTMDPVRGYSSIMRQIFGKPIPGSDPLSVLMFFATVPPNVLMPDWWLEGMATWAETQYTPAGRGRSSYYEMIFRMAVYENNIPSVDKINGDVPYWPNGHLPYIYGLALQRYIAKTAGNETLGDLNTAHSGRFPYFIGAPARRLTGKPYSLLYKDMIKEMKDEQEGKIRTLSSAAFTNSSVIATDGEMLTNPRISKNSLLAINREDPHEHDSIVIYKYPSMEKLASFRHLPSDKTLSWSPDGRRIYFSQADLKGGYNLFQDIYYYDLKDEKTVRLTKNLRLKEPDVSPDGKSLVAVMINGISQSLVIIKETDDKPQIQPIIEYKGVRVSNPRYSPDGKSVSYSVRDDRGNTAIYVLDLSLGQAVKIIEDSFDNGYPIWSSDGRFIIFTSDRNGVYNLYAYSLADAKVLRITHLLGGAFYPEVVPDGIIYSGYTSRGFRLERINYEPEKWTEEPAPSIKPYWPYTQVEASSECRTEAEKSVSGSDKKPSRYLAFDSLVPRFWLPTLRTDHDGAVLGAFTAGQDVLGYHTYVLEASYGFESANLYYDATYLYDRFYPSFLLKAYKKEFRYTDFFSKDKDMDERQQVLSGTIILPYRRLESRLSLFLGYEFKEHNQTSGQSPVFEGRRDNIFGGFQYGNTLKYPYSISREEGRAIAFTYRNYSRHRMSNVDSEEYTGRYKEYIRIWRHSVLTMDFKGGISSGQRIPQQAFQLGGTENDNENFPLRGYPARFKTGKYIATASAEYRMPIWYIFKGPGTKPFFLDRLHAAAFTDAGLVWDRWDNVHGRDIKIGAGVEARLDMVLGYKFKITPAIGLAHGFSGGGETSVYIAIYSDL